MKKSGSKPCFIRVKLKDGKIIRWAQNRTLLNSSSNNTGNLQLSVKSNCSKWSRLLLIPLSPPPKTPRLVPHYSGSKLKLCNALLSLMQIPAFLNSSWTCCVMPRVGMVRANDQMERQAWSQVSRNFTSQHTEDSNSAHLTHIGSYQVPRLLTIITYG